MFSELCICIIKTTTQNKFKFTDTERTQKSYTAFITGLFGRNHIHKVWHPEPMKRDPILRFYKLCNRWIFEVDKNERTMHEVQEWHQSAEMKRAVYLISTKAGLPRLSIGNFT